MEEVERCYVTPLVFINIKKKKNRYIYLQYIHFTFSVCIYIINIILIEIDIIFLFSHMISNHKYTHWNVRKCIDLSWHPTISSIFVDSHFWFEYTTQDFSPLFVNRVNYVYRPANLRKTKCLIKPEYPQNNVGGRK